MQGLLFTDPVTVDGAANSIQNLVVKVDSGSAVTKALTTNCNTVAACITALGGASGITGATISAVGGKIMIKSTSTGTSSTIVIDASSGDGAEALFGSPDTVNGAANSNQVLKVSVDGATAIEKTLTVNCNTVAACITALGGVSGITGATISEVSGKILITSSSTGASSTIVIEASSGSNAKALFTNPVTSEGQLDRVPNSDKSTANSITQSGGSLTCDDSFYATGTEASKVGAVTCNAAGDYSGVTCAPLTCRFLICSLIPNTAAI